MTTWTVLALATWRLSSLLAQEAGPWNVFGQLRFHAGGELGKAVSCLWCSSVWIGAALAILARLRRGLAFWLCLPLALSAVAILIEEVLPWHEPAS